VRLALPSTSSANHPTHKGKKVRVRGLQARHRHLARNRPIKASCNVCRVENAALQRPALETVGNRSLAKRVKTVFRSHQEIHVTNQVNGLVELARKQNDYITINFLQWFLTEQLEEVSLMDNLLKIIERAGDDLLQADEYLARVGVRAIPEPLKE
jgi:Ferritin-like domain